VDVLKSAESYDFVVSKSLIDKLSPMRVLNLEEVYVKRTMMCSNHHVLCGNQQVECFGQAAQIRELGRAR
jgi:hypothetical protein